MAAQERSRSRPARLDGDDSDGVVSASYPRKAQKTNSCVRVSIVKEWARLLGINNQGESVDEKLITGEQPVLIDEPAIVIRAHPNGGGPNE